jgi:hypothetical protein
MTGAHDLEEVLERQPLVENSQNVKQKRINDPDPRIRVSAKVNCFERRRRLKAMKEVSRGRKMIPKTIVTIQ